MNYDDIVQAVKDAGLYRRHLLIATKNKNKYLKIYLNQTGWPESVRIIREKVESFAGNQRTFSHNPRNATITFTLY
jgi:hypothetical protein